jgi:tRNA-modifying protein YgfZ
MTRAKIAKLEDRGAIAVRGPDAVKFLQGLVTNDLEPLQSAQDQLAVDAAAAHTALLSPQGKILFEFFCLRTPEGFVLDTLRSRAGDLIKRLTMYKLRAAVEIQDVSDRHAMLVLWGAGACSSGPTQDTIAFQDPRHGDLGQRILAEARFAMDIASATNGETVSAQDYHAHRIALGIPDGGADYDLGDTYPHEANLDRLHGVSFTKGCYVGQEIVARMQHKTAIRKRVIPVVGVAALPADRPDIMAGDVSIGKLGSVSGTRGLALIRLDRAAEFATRGQGLTAGGVGITIERPEWMPPAALQFAKEA